MPLIFDADKLDYYDEKGIIEGWGNVYLRHKEMELKADYVRFELNSKDIFAKGNVVFFQKAEEIHANEMNYNLREELGTAEEVSTFNKPWYINSQKSTRSGPNEYLLERGVFTTCDLSPPHYRFTTKRMKVCPDDHFIAYHSVFYLRNIPLMYLPICRRSLKGSPSGLVVKPGYSSEKGFFVLSHYNWYLSKSFNGRWYGDYFGDRGVGKGFDVNLNYGVNRPGWAYLYGYHIDERESPVEGQPAEERWKLHFRQRQRIAKRTTGIVRIDKLSDKYFNDDYLDEEVLHFLSRRDLESHRPEGSLSITRNTPDYSSSIYVRKRINSFQDITESLPRVSFNLVEDSVGESLFYRDLDANFAYLHREMEITVEAETEDLPDGDGTDGGETSEEAAAEDEETVTAIVKKKIVQFDLHPELSYQARLGLFRAKPTVGLDGYWYSEDEVGEDGRSEWAYEASLPLRMAYGIWRIFDTANWPVIKKVRHSILPRVTYYYSPDPGDDGENIYGFCSRVGNEQSRVKLELINSVEGKGEDGKEGKIKGKLRKVKGGTRKVRGKARRIHQMLYFDVYTYHDFLKEEEPWSDIYADLKIRSLKDIYWRTRVSYDPYVEKFESLNTDFSVEKEDWEFWAGTRIYRPGGEERTFDLLGKVETSLGRKWRVDLQSRYDMNEAEFKVRRVSLYRDLHCWEAQLFWQNEKKADDKDETKIFFGFRIKGVPGVSLKAPIGDFFWETE